MNLSERIVERVLKDLRGRSGFDGAWDACDEDIQAEIKTDLIEIVDDELETSGEIDGG